MKIYLISILLVAIFLILVGGKGLFSENASPSHTKRGKTNFIFSLMGVLLVFSLNFLI